MNTLKTVIFDCDGTLVDSAGHIFRAMSLAFACHDLPPPDHADVRGVVGLNLHDAIAALAPKADESSITELGEAFRQAYQQDRIDQSSKGLPPDIEPLFPGIADLLKDLDRAGVMLAVATGNSSRGLRRILEGHALTHHFASLQTADINPSKPHPGMVHAALADCGGATDQAIVIGDTHYDMAMARNAGTHAIGVDWGYHSPDQLLRAGAVEVVSDTERLAIRIDALFSGG